MRQPETEPHGTLRWFGPSWGAPVNDPPNEIPVPLGMTCLDCGEVIRDERTPGVTLPYTDGTKSETVAYHRDCFLKSMGVATTWRDTL